MQETKGQMICKYQLLRLLGRGATSEVFLVRQEDSGQFYALKKGENREVLRAEAAVLKGIKSHIFPSFQEYLPEEDCLVMEYIEGESLSKLLGCKKAFEIGEVMYVMQEVLGGLLFLQERQMVYRDLKPDNIMIEPSGRIRLIDLGSVLCLGQQTGDKIVHAGTYGYAAPEQFWPGAEADFSCDVYAAGTLLLYLLTGKDPAIPPYHMEEAYKKSMRIPLPFREVLDRCLAMNPQADMKMRKFFGLRCREPMSSLRGEEGYFFRKAGTVFMRKAYGRVNMPKKRLRNLPFFFVDGTGRQKV